MLLDFVMIFFLLFMSYCLYLLVIVPYNEKKQKELLDLDKYIKQLEDTKQAVADKMSAPRL
jgi:hypothetical protein